MLLAAYAAAAKTTPTPMPTGRQIVSTCAPKILPRLPLVCVDAGRQTLTRTGMERRIVWMAVLWMQVLHRLGLVAVAFARVTPMVMESWIVSTSAQETPHSQWPGSAVVVCFQWTLMVTESLIVLTHARTTHTKPRQSECAGAG